MSCLNLMRLLPHRKLWKLFKSKLPLKIHKLTSSNALKKHTIQQRKQCSNKKSYNSKRNDWPYLSIQPKKFKKKVPYTNKVRICSNKKVPPIYVDELFIEPVVKSRVLMPEVLDREIKEVKPFSSSSSKRNMDSHKRFTRPSPSNKDTSQLAGDRKISPDDMWESLAMAPPQTDGIDERAEEFIARFRAEMQNQEMLARRL